MRVPAEPAAREHYKQGNRLYRLRKFEEAILEYQAGALLEPVAVFDYNLGQCYRQLGKYREAIWHYELFLKNSPPDKKHHGLVTGFVSQMRAEMDRKAMTQPPTDLPPEPRSSPPPPPPTHTAPIVRDPWYSDGVGWILVGVGVTGIGIGGGLLFSATNLRDDANTALAEAQRRELRNTADKRERVGIALGIGGGVMMIGGLVKLVMHPKKSPRAGGAWLEFNLSPHGLVAHGRF